MIRIMSHPLVSAAPGENVAPLHALVVSGSGRYADPWHPFRETSSRLAEVIASQGIDVDVSEGVDRAFAHLQDVSSRPNLLVVNIGNPEPSAPEPDARAGIEGFVASGGAILAVHSSATAFTEWPGWRDILGGRWVRGTTFHPPQQRDTVRLRSGHPVAHGLTTVTLFDEFYTALEVDPSVDIIAEHRHDGQSYPLIWSHRVGASRIIYDALGHDAASFEHGARADLIAAELRWLLSPDAELSQA